MGAPRKGWFKLPGQDGDRTLEEQLVAVRPALTEAAGKPVLDLGSAEGLIAREFARVGAARVDCMESVEEHIKVGREICAGLPVTFTHVNLNKAVPEDTRGYDIVLALGILHKLREPATGLRFAAGQCAGLLLIRSGRGAVNGVIRSKHYQNSFVDAWAALPALGFTLERVVAGPKERLEDVEYWRRA